LQYRRELKKTSATLGSSCKALRNAAYDSFAFILSDRCFRLTNTGLPDLVGIIAVPGLASHIRILTLGCAQMGGKDERPYYQTMRSIVKSINDAYYEHRSS
jgi:hypothetical protein